MLIHGSFQGAWIWKPTARALRSAGHEVYTPTLEGCAERKHALRPGITVTTAADELAALLFYEDLDDVIVAATSSGGLVAQKLAAMASERIARLVFVDALVPRVGESVADIVQRPADAPPYERTELARGPSRDQLRNGLFAEFGPELLEWAVARGEPHPIGLSDQQPGELDDFWSRQWDATVVCCTQSANPPNGYQKAVADQLNARWIELDAGHYPMLTHGEALAALLQG
jgi:pimeloyl-ACP methyl ester carboxylesterase